MKAAELIRQYHLEPHPEGGFFAETYCSKARDKKGRPYTGSIYFLLDREDVSHLHIIDCEEIWYYHAGGGMVITMVKEDGTVIRKKLCKAHPMVVIPEGVMFAAKNLRKNTYTFVSCVTSPHFTYDGFHIVTLAELKRKVGAVTKELMALVQSES